MEDGIGLSNFRIICVAVVSSSYVSAYQAGVFTSDDSSWRTICIHGQSRFRQFNLLGHSKGSIYWWVNDRMVVAVDTTTAELTPSVLPEVQGLNVNHNMTVTTGRDRVTRILLSKPYGFDDMKP